MMVVSRKVMCMIELLDELATYFHGTSFERISDKLWVFRLGTVFGSFFLANYGSKPSTLRETADSKCYQMITLELSNKIKILKNLCPSL